MKKIVSIFLSLMILTSVLIAASAEGAYPMEGDKQLTVYLVGGLTMHSDYVSEDESPYHRYIEEYTGVDVEWQRAPAGADENMAYNMMIASGKYPDIVYNWNLPTYAETAIADGIMQPIEDYMEFAPALSAYIERHPEVRKAITTDNGHMYAFPFLYEDPQYLGTTQGVSVNMKLLAQTGLDKPVTMADWEEVLYAFKDLEECDYPFCVSDNFEPRVWFGNAFGFNGYDRYYVNMDGEVETWMTHPGYKEFLAVMNRWYNDGILDRDFATTDLMGLVNKIVTTNVGAVYYGLNTPARFYDQLVKRDGEFTYEPATQVVATEGDTVCYAMGANEWLGVGAFITTACSDIPTAMKFLDWFYTDEGFVVSNFGKEGESYHIGDDGKPHVNAEILNAAEGSTSALSRYTAMTGVGIGIQSIDWFNDKSLPFVPGMIEAWIKNSVAGEHHWPCVCATAEEGVELANLENSVITYAEEMYLNFIIGAEPLNKFDEYVKNINEMGLERIIEIRTQGLERYNNR